MKSAQRGAALLAMLAVLVLGTAWWTVSALDRPLGRTAEDRAHNARLLQSAKAALIGHVAHRAAMTTENDPGRLPCPESPGSIGGPNEGIAAGNCTLPAVGRLPWRTLGLDKLRDASGEPLWYVVSPGWGKPNALTNTTINSDSRGQLTLDGSGDVVALLIAPGPPLSVEASPGCAARVQRRMTPSPAIDRRDYLECENSSLPADAAFVTNGPAGSFNDHVVAVTGADVLPAIEAAIAARFEREIAPGIRSAYSGGSWPAAPALPFAAPFMVPTASNFKGAASTFQGLLPATYSTDPATGGPCAPGADARCDPLFVAWLGAPAPAASWTGGAILAPSPTACIVTTTQTTQIDCVLHAYWPWNGNLNFSLQARARNAGMALRQLDLAVAMPGVDAAGRAASGVLNSDGSATITLNASVAMGLPVGDALCGLAGVMAALFDCFRYTISVPIALLADQPQVRPNHWFARNRWHEVAYYAVAPNIAPSGARACVTGSSCLQVAFHPADGNQRGLIALAGRALAGQARPALAVADWLEGANADGASPFALRSPALMVNRSFNDRIAVIDANP